MSTKTKRVVDLGKISLVLQRDKNDIPTVTNEELIQECLSTIQRMVVKTRTGAEYTVSSMEITTYAKTSTS